MSTHPSYAQRGSAITNYYTPCEGGTQGDVSTFHGANRDGTYPVDMNRRSFDFRCSSTRVYSPTNGHVHSLHDGYMLIEDGNNTNTCLLLLHMESYLVQAGQQISAGTLVGNYSATYGHVHVAAFNASCSTADTLNGNIERPIIWREIGYEMPVDLTLVPNNVVYFTSQNYSGVSGVAHDYNGDGIPDMWAIHRNDNGQTAFHVVDGNDPSRFLANRLTLIHNTDNANWSFDVADYNRDGMPDVWAINRNDNGQTAFHVIDGNDPSRYLSQQSTLLHNIDRATWSVAVADYNGDGTPDLWGIHRNDNGQTAFHVVDGNDSSRFLANRLTLLHNTDNANWSFDVADYNRDGTPDLWAIHRDDNGQTAFHVIDGNDPSRYLANRLTLLHRTNTNDWSFMVDDYNRDGTPDLWTFDHDDDGTTAFHIIDGTNPDRYLSQRQTILHNTSRNWFIGDRYQLWVSN